MLQERRFVVSQSTLTTQCGNSLSSVVDCRRHIFYWDYASDRALLKAYAVRLHCTACFNVHPFVLSTSNKNDVSEQQPTKGLPETDKSKSRDEDKRGRLQYTARYLPQLLV